jgi:hypothetical protein
MKVGGEYGHVGNGRQTQSLGERMGGQSRAEQNEVLVAFILAITMVGPGKWRRRETVFKSIGRDKQNKRSRQT